jgi:endonuclease YncB( thermonuclease family)
MLITLAPSHIPRYLLLMLIGSLKIRTMSAVALILLLATPTVSAWETLEGVRLSQSRSNDGDSFRVIHRGKEYIFRLYGADCPETDMSFPDRVSDQASDFGVSPSSAIEWGHRATARATSLLRSPFRVVTKWEGAMGRSSLPRHYAYVLPSGGGDLSATLLMEGLARARGMSPPPPQGFPRVGSSSEYRLLQSRARAAGNGVWGTSASPSSRNTDISEQSVRAETVNVNTAEAHELESLPGIGPALAERIIKARPLRGEADLLAVPGLGPSTLAQIRSLVAF